MKTYMKVVLVILVNTKPKSNAESAADKLVDRLLYAMYCPASSLGDRSLASAGTDARIGLMATDQGAAKISKRVKSWVNPITIAVTAQASIA
jgi:hypothetical protein